MATLDELLTMPGGHGGWRVQCGRYVGGIQGQDGNVAGACGDNGQICATVTMMFNTLAGAFTQLSKMNWVPQKGWAYSGGDWTVAVGGNRGVFVETARADFNKLFETLVGPR